MSKITPGQQYYRRAVSKEKGTDTEELTEGLRSVEESDSVTERPACRDWFGMPVEFWVLSFMAALDGAWAISYVSANTIPLYTNGTSYMAFQKKTFYIQNPSNTSTHSKAYLPAENNGDKYHIQALFAAIVWIFFFIYALAAAWVAIVNKFSNDRKKTFWGINHFAVYFARGFFYIVAWPIMFFMFGYDEYPTLMAGFFMPLVVQLVSLAMSTYNQAVAEYGPPKINPMFTLFSLFVVAISIATTIAFPASAFKAWEDSQTTTPVNYRAMNPYINTRIMFIALMFDLCFNHLATFYKWCGVLYALTCGHNKIVDEIMVSIENSVDGLVENVVERNRVGKYSGTAAKPPVVKYIVEILEHLSASACMITFIIHYHASYSNVNWPTA